MLSGDLVDEIANDWLAIDGQPLELTVRRRGQLRR
jgi:hypothetical protein